MLINLDLDQVAVRIAQKSGEALPFRAGGDLGLLGGQAYGLEGAHHFVDRGPEGDEAEVRLGKIRVGRGIGGSRLEQVEDGGTGAERPDLVARLGDPFVLDAQPEAFL